MISLSQHGRHSAIFITEETGIMNCLSYMPDLSDSPWILFGKTADNYSPTPIGLIFHPCEILPTCRAKILFDIRDNPW